MTGGGTHDSMYDMPRSRPTRRDFGLAIPDHQPVEVPLSFRTREADAEALRVLAKEAGVGRSTLIRLIIEKWLGEHRRPPKRGR